MDVPNGKISIQDVALLRGVSVKTVRRWISSGALPAYRTGPKLLRVDPADLDKLDRRIPTAGSR